MYVMGVGDAIVSRRPRIHYCSGGRDRDMWHDSSGHLHLDGCADGDWVGFVSSGIDGSADDTGGVDLRGIWHVWAVGRRSQAEWGCTGIGGGTGFHEDVDEAAVLCQRRWGLQRRCQLSRVSSRAWGSTRGAKERTWDTARGL